MAQRNDNSRHRLSTGASTMAMAAALPRYKSTDNALGDVVRSFGKVFSLLTMSDAAFSASQAGSDSEDIARRAADAQAEAKAARRSQELAQKRGVSARNAHVKASDRLQQSFTAEFAAAQERLDRGLERKLERIDRLKQNATHPLTAHALNMADWSYEKLRNYFRQPAGKALRQLLLAYVAVGAPIQLFGLTAPLEQFGLTGVPGLDRADNWIREGSYARIDAQNDRIMREALAQQAGRQTDEITTDEKKLALLPPEITALAETDPKDAAQFISDVFDGVSPAAIDALYDKLEAYRHRVRTNSASGNDERASLFHILWNEDPLTVGWKHDIANDASFLWHRAGQGITHLRAYESRKLNADKDKTLGGSLARGLGWALAPSQEAIEEASIPYVTPVEKPTFKPLTVETHDAPPAQAIIAVALESANDEGQLAISRNLLNAIKLRIQVNSFYTSPTFIKIHDALERILDPNSLSQYQTEMASAFDRDTRYKLVDMEVANLSGEVTANGNQSIQDALKFLHQESILFRDRYSLTPDVAKGMLGAHEVLKLYAEKTGKKDFNVPFSSFYSLNDEGGEQAGIHAGELVAGVHDPRKPYPSSALGPAQFLVGTWADTVKTYGPAAKLLCEILAKTQGNEFINYSKAATDIDEMMADIRAGRLEKAHLKAADPFLAYLFKGFLQGQSMQNIHNNLTHYVEKASDGMHSDDAATRSNSVDAYQDANTIVQAFRQLEGRGSFWRVNHTTGDALAELMARHYLGNLGHPDNVTAADLLRAAGHSEIYEKNPFIFGGQIYYVHGKAYKTPYRTFGQILDFFDKVLPEQTLYALTMMAATDKLWHHGSDVRADASPALAGESVSTVTLPDATLRITKDERGITGVTVLHRTTGAAILKPHSPRIIPPRHIAKPSVRQASLQSAADTTRPHNHRGHEASRSPHKRRALTIESLLAR